MIDKPAECTCKTNPSPMFHGRNCPVFLHWKESEKPKTNTTDKKGK